MHKSPSQSKIVINFRQMHYRRSRTNLELVNRTRSLLAEMSRRNHGLSAPSRESTQQPFARYYENGQREGVSARSARRTSARSGRSASSRPGSARVSRPQSAVQSGNLQSRKIIRKHSEAKVERLEKAEQELSQSIQRTAKTRLAANHF